jgi:hypothetical protein
MNLKSFYIFSLQHIMMFVVVLCKYCKPLYIVLYINVIKKLIKMQIFFHSIYIFSIFFFHFFIILWIDWLVYLAYYSFADFVGWNCFLTIFSFFFYFLRTLSKRIHDKRTFWTSPKKEYLNNSLFCGTYNILNIKSVYF